VKISVCGFVIAIFQLASGLAVAETVDLEVVHRIKQEAFYNSSVMDYMSLIADENGPRMSGSTGYRRAAEKAVAAFKEAGIEDAGLEVWGTLGRGWDWSRVTVQMKQPHETTLTAIPADFSPDARYEYSNTNYLLLAKILDAALGYSHYSYIQNVILDPLNMRDTYHLVSEVDASQLVHGYWDGRDKTLQDYAIPGGAMVSTPADIAILLRALATGDLLTEAERSTYASVYWYQHSGWIPGYQSIARYEEVLDAVVVLFMNKTGDGSEQIIADTYNQVIAVLQR
jgi:CubicO group peptidase (beta-lactamase class C family)